MITNKNGNVVELRCIYDEKTKGGTSPDGRKVKATLHWVSAHHAAAAEVRLYDRLFVSPRPGENSNLIDDLNPASVETLTDCKLEPALASLNEETTVQFERLGYFCFDRENSAQSASFNRTATLRDTWAKMQAQTAR